MSRQARDSELVFNSDTDRAMGVETSNTNMRNYHQGSEAPFSQPGAEALSYMNHKEISLLNAL